MSIVSVLRCQIRPKKLARWEARVGQIAERARERSEPLRWRCAQVVAGELGSFQITVSAGSVAEAAARETPQALVGRLFDADEAESILKDARSAIGSVTSAILSDRPDLSHPGETETEQPVAAIVTRMVVRPGYRDACEELLRKLAEAIAKTDDARRFEVYQPLIGDLRLLAAVRPVFDLAELDRTTSVEELINQAFGIGEGGLVFRAGLEGSESLTSELLLMRPDLSHPAAA
jgi:hypothetical protein